MFKNLFKKSQIKDQSIKNNNLEILSVNEMNCVIGGTSEQIDNIDNNTTDELFHSAHDAPMPAIQNMKG